jgi:hypothetical protein
VSKTKKDILKELRFGNQIAEEERDDLKSYFVETQSWRKIIGGDVDVVYGTKGAGKSALYLLVQDHIDNLFDDGVLVVVAENPRGSPAFESLTASPPPDEKHFINLWKLYFLSLIGRELTEYGINNSESLKIISTLKQEGLLPEKGTSLKKILSIVKSYVNKYMNPTSVETTILTSESTGNINGITGRIYFSESAAQAAKFGEGASVDDLFSLVSEGLTKQNISIWILLDRLDVAFDDSEALERNALRSLFKAYRDIRAYDNIILKIFLRSDIWDRITDEGFREATHISRDIKLEWDKPSLQNLVARRFLNNEAIAQYLAIDPAEVINDASKQLEFLSKILPDQVETGKRQSSTFDWILKRTTDGSGKNAPREIIFFFNSMIENQLKRLDRGENSPAGTQLFDRAAFKDSLPALSEYRLAKVLYAEYPDLKPYIEKLSSQKSEHNTESLSRIWGTAPSQTIMVTDKLVKIGFFETDPNKETVKIPYIYRPALAIIQGKAEELGK